MIEETYNLKMNSKLARKKCQFLETSQKYYTASYLHLTLKTCSQLTNSNVCMFTNNLVNF